MSTPYEGEKLKVKPSEGPELQPYIPDKGLIRAVQLAQILQRPLLLKGEPGCGKTRLAQAVAYELFGKDYEQHYFEWFVRSTSKAQEGLYEINYLKQLRDANIQRATKKNLRLYPGSEYLTLGVLGKAFDHTTIDAYSELPPPVVLIDEIDKADIDFPNDLLQELDNMKFIIPGAVTAVGSKIPLEIKAKEGKKPLVIITSNDEKALPAAFLRRCLFYYIDFPAKEDLEVIVSSHFPKLKPALRDAAIKKFMEARNGIASAAMGNKNISTSELLDWVKIIDHYAKEGKPDPDFADGFPFYEVLLKDIESVKQFIVAKEISKATV